MEMKKTHSVVPTRSGDIEMDSSPDNHFSSKSIHSAQLDSKPKKDVTDTVAKDDKSHIDTLKIIEEKVSKVSQNLLEPTMAKLGENSTRLEELERLMKRLQPVFELADLTRENGMSSSMEYIVEQASKTSQNFVIDRFNKFQRNLDALKVSMVFGDDYSNTKNKLFMLETRFNHVASSQELIETKFIDINHSLEK
jgi:hypothetical protein